MKTLLAVSTLVLVAGCASLEPAPPLAMLSQASNPEFTPIFQAMYEQHSKYLAKAERLRRESGWIDGVGLTAQIATLGFAGYKAHADNILAAALTGGVTTTARATLNPREQARLYTAGASALACVAQYAESLTYVPVGSRAKVTDNLVANNSLGSSNTYVELQIALRGYLTVAASIAQPSADLKAAIVDAQAADQQLTIGIDAQATAKDDITEAWLAIHRAIENYELPSMQSLLAAISKIEIPKPPVTSSTGAPSPTDPAKLAALVSSQAASDAETKDRLNAMVTYIRSIRPQGDAEKALRMKTCVAALSGRVPAAALAPAN